MSPFVDRPVRVSVPATSANLGPGFDSLGLALDLRDDLEAEVGPAGLVVTVDGHGSGEVPLDEAHLVVRAMRAACELLGVMPPGLRLRCRNVVPHTRGLGSSSAAVVGGITLARALVHDGLERLDDAAALRLATDLEGHPDNVAPALMGGFVISGRDEDGEVYAVCSPVAPEVRVIVFVPPEPLSTAVARALLPDVVPHAAAAAGAGNAALLVAALAGRTDQLWRATRDLLHQDYRRPAMPASLALVEELRGDDVAAVVSGAGPSVLAFFDGDISDLASALGRRTPVGWVSYDLGVDRDGAVIH